jgi:predicted CoA-substrate-specific enzyme activase
MMHHYAGCDIGSTTGKAVIMEGDTIAATALLPSCVDPEETARLVLREATSKVPALAQGGRVKYLVGTGYGRNEVPFANENISEITCHAVGAHWCDPTIRTIVDVGGQDVKAVGLNGDGTVREFSMNDKCAAGTGRFYEAMSRIFRTDLEEFARLSLQAKRAIPITSQCSVFAETEVISLISKRNAPADIAAGVQAAVAKRIFSLTRRVGVEPALTITGGCAKNAGLVQMVSKTLRLDVVLLKVDPQLIGALGAAVMAKRRCEQGRA